MNIYVGHSRKIDYINNLYKPIKDSSLNKHHKFIFPHDEGKQFVNSKEIIRNSDLVIAEVSYPSTALGIELGWADAFKIPIVCIYEKGKKVSESIKEISKNIYEYYNKSEIPTVIEQCIE